MPRARDVETTAKVSKDIDRLGHLGWYHSIELRDGSVITGLQSLDHLRERIARYPIPADLRGKRVLDIGAWDGWFSFEMERRGAEVVAVDSAKQRTFLEAKRLLNSKVEYIVEDVCHLSPRDVGYFDIVLFFGVLYHLKHPLLAMERVCELTRDMMCIETFVTDDPAQWQAVPLLEFYETTELAGQFDNWCGPNTSCLLAYMRTAGFVKQRLIGTWGHRAYAVAYRKWPEIARSGAAPEVLCVENTWTHDHEFRSDRDDYFTVWFKTECTGLNEDNVFVQVGPFAVRPAGVRNVGREGWQANCKLPPGLTRGWFDVTIATGDSVWSPPARIAVDLPRDNRRRQDRLSSRMKIDRVTDGKTYEPGRVYTGTESCLSVWAENLPSDIAPAEVTLRLDGTGLPAIYVSGTDAAGHRQINALLPPSMEPGEYRIAVACRGEESPSVGIELAANERQ